MGPKLKAVMFGRLKMGFGFLEAEEKVKDMDIQTRVSVKDMRAEYEAATSGSGLDPQVSRDLIQKSHTSKTDDTQVFSVGDSVTSRVEKQVRSGGEVFKLHVGSVGKTTNAWLMIFEVEFDDFS